MEAGKEEGNEERWSYKGLDWKEILVLQNDWETHRCLQKRERTLVNNEPPCKLSITHPGKTSEDSLI